MITEKVQIVQGDITMQHCDTIVNAANSSLLGGGGVDGAIHRAAGPELLEECRRLNGCPPGEARITRSYRLPGRFIIHTVGPVYRGGKNREAEFLRSAYTSSMKFILSHQIKSIAFPAISTGVYGYPKDEACRIALHSVLSFRQNEKLTTPITFVLFDVESLMIYKQVFSEISEDDIDSLLPIQFEI